MILSRRTSQFSYVAPFNHQATQRFFTETLEIRHYNIGKRFKLHEKWQNLPTTARIYVKLSVLNRMNPNSFVAGSTFPFNKQDF